MVDRILIYVEGGGRGGASKVRQGFSGFLVSLKRAAESRGINFLVVPCGGRGETFENFKRALAHERKAFPILLVDAEGPVQALTWVHLAQQDHWTRPNGASDDQCQLMAQAMEAWLIADPDNLARYYGQGFKRNALPRNADVEQIDRPRLMTALQSATRGTGPGEYHKIRHGPTLLAQTDPRLVRGKARHCDRLFSILENLLHQESG